MAKSLPIWDIHGDLLAAWNQGNRLVLVAPTGSGKTTQVPQMFLDSGLAGDKRIVVLQPRRVAARSVAARVAWERNSKVGHEVGYQIRFEDATGLGTRICFVTEGILLRWLQDSSALPDVGMIIYDEFHERNLLSDVALALGKKLQAGPRPDLRLMVMSATLEAEPVAAYLGDCPILKSEGQSFPVEVRFAPQKDTRPIAEQAVEALDNALSAGEPGDVLIFMPGMQEINNTLRACRALRNREPLELIPLHGDLPPEEQDRAFAPSSNRKVIVSTNVAETSVTIDGVRHVIDSGLARVARFDGERGIGTLALEEISRASSDQRKGRAGRTAPGTCIRLWTESNHLNRPARNTPEIQRADLAEVVLLLHSLGVNAAASFDWLTPPDPAAVESAERLLWMLGALTGPSGAESHITKLGRQMLRLPMHPRFSRMLLEAKERHCLIPAALCAALVSGRDFMLRLGREDNHIANAREQFEANPGSDFFTLLSAYNWARQQSFDLNACRRMGLHSQIGWQVAQTHAQLLEIFGKRDLAAEDGTCSAESLQRAIMTGFVDQLCLRKDKGTLDCDVVGGRKGVLVRESIVQKAPLFVVASIKEVSGKGGTLTLLSLATALEISWLRETFPQHFSVRVEHLYDRTHKRVAAVKLERFLDLVISKEHHVTLDPLAAGMALAQAYRDGAFELPLFNHEVKQLLGRASVVAAAAPELEFPALSPERVTECLAQAFSGLTLAKEAQATPLKASFEKTFGAAAVEWLNELAPLTTTWSDGRKLKLLYPELGSEEKSPELQVKLHECFGLEAHPRICEGRVPVKLWLAGPDGKRIEPTLDWPSFKSKQYPKLKPALQKKYPGVAWL